DVADGHDRPGPFHHSAARLVLEDRARLSAGPLIRRGQVLPAPCPGLSAIGRGIGKDAGCGAARGSVAVARQCAGFAFRIGPALTAIGWARSEEHTSELQ